MALRNGSRLGVSMHDVFPHGCHLVPGAEPVAPELIVDWHLSPLA